MECSPLAMKEKYPFTLEESKYNVTVLEKDHFKILVHYFKITFQTKLHLRRIKFEKKRLQLRLINILFKFSRQQLLLF